MRPTRPGYHRDSVSISWIWWFLTVLAVSVGWIVDQQIGLVFGSIVLGFGCGVAFFRMGGQRITATGIYFLSIGVLVAAPVVAIELSQSGIQTPGLLAFTTAVSISTVLTYSVRMGIHTTNWWDPPIGDSIYTASSARWLAVVGVVSLGSSIVLADLGGKTLHALTLALASIGVIAVAANVFLISQKRFTRRVAGATAIALTAFLVFISWFFSGSGRLILVGLFLAALLVAATIAPQRWHKLLIVGALLPAILVAGLIRAGGSGQEPLQTTVSQILVDQRGLGSWTSPAETAAQLISHDRAHVGTGFPRQYGATYLEALVIPIPRSIWANKPFGFGFRLTEVLAPSLTRYGHSMAATAFGEAYVNFGWLGFVILGAIMSPVLAALDRWQLRIARSDLDPPAILRLLIFVMIVAGIPDFIWGGLASSTARAGIRVIVLLGVLVMVTRTYATTHPVRYPDRRRTLA